MQINRKRKKKNPSRRRECFIFLGLMLIDLTVIFFVVLNNDVIKFVDVTKIISFDLLHYRFYASFSAENA